MQGEINIEQLFRHYYQSLYVYAYQILQNEEICKDMVADTFEYVLCHSDRVVEETVQSLLFLTLRSRCLDHLRHEKVRHEYEQYYKTITRLDAENSYREYEERSRLVSSALMKLPERSRAMLEACYQERKKYEEVGRAYGITKHAVRKQVYKALAFLREEVARMKSEREDPKNILNKVSLSDGDTYIYKKKKD